MRAAAEEYPQYGFDVNAGYLSAGHQAALRHHGPTPLHRPRWKFMNDLPQYAHLRRLPPPLDEVAGQLSLL